MNKEQALLMIKELINKSIQGGIFINAEEVINVVNAFNLIAKEIVPDENPK